MRRRETSAVAGLSAVALALSVAAVGCNSGEASSGGEVGFSEAFLTDPFQVQMVQQMEQQAEEQGVSLLPAVNANGDAAKQNDDINTLLSRGVDGLLVSVVDAEAIVPVIERANEAGVPVVAVDLAPSGGEVDMIVRADNTYMGSAACEALGQKMGGEGTALNLQGDQASSNGRDRSDGFTDCMGEKFPDIEIVSKPFNWSAEECVEQAQTVLSTMQIDGIYMASEIGCLAAVRKALSDQGRWVPAGDPNHIPTVGIDGSAAALDAVRDGYLDAVISQPLDAYSKWGVYYIKAAMSGTEFKEGPTDHGSTIVKVGESYADLLPSPTVTKENVDDPSLWGNR